MSMEFSDMNQVGGSGALTGLLAGCAMKKDDDKTASTMMIVLAVIFFVIIFIIAIIALAMFNRDHKRDYNGGTDIAALLTPLIAAKGLDCNNGCKNGEIDKLEIMQKLEHNEDRAETRRIQDEQNRQTQSLTQLGFGLANMIKDVEVKDADRFAKIEYQNGLMQTGIAQLLQKSNNEDIIQGVIARLTCAPCAARC